MTAQRQQQPMTEDEMLQVEFSRITIAPGWVEWRMVLPTGEPSNEADFVLRGSLATHRFSSWLVQYTRALATAFGLRPVVTMLDLLGAVVDANKRAEDRADAFARTRKPA
jgi:hypothetical protein